VGFTILWSVVLNLLGLSGLLPALSIAGPVILSVLAAIVIYFLRDHRIIEYDDRGYQEKVGKKNLVRHEWSEFRECSLVNHGHLKVRVYYERDGPHSDIDSSACGLDPYKFRDFVSSRIDPNLPNRRPTDFISGMERELQQGRTRWIADLSESFRDLAISGEVFPLVARGGTRPKGFLLSRFLSFTVMPNYNVCLYAQRINGPRTKEYVMRLLRIVETQRDQRNIKWSWLLLLGDDSPPDSVNRVIGEFGNKDIGLGFINISTGEIYTSPNQLGRSMANQMRLNHLVSDLRRLKYLG